MERQIWGTVDERRQRPNLIACRRDALSVVRGSATCIAEQTAAKCGTLIASMVSTLDCHGNKPM
jgi:hypothetical protein